MKLQIIALFIVAAGLLMAGPREGVSSGVPSFLDTDGDGVISEAERQAFDQARREVRNGAFDRWDENRDGEIDLGERQKAVDHMRALVREQRGRLFEAVAGPDGILTFEEARENIVPLRVVPEQVAVRLFAMLDGNGDGDVTKEEFLNKLERGPPSDSPSPGNRQ